MWKLDHTAARSLVNIEVVLKSRIVNITRMLEVYTSFEDIYCLYWLCVIGVFK